MARELAHRLGVPWIELESLFHRLSRSDSGAPDSGEFRRRVAEAVARREWVIDGNFSSVRDLVWGSADTVVWLDLPRWQVMARVVRRSVARVVLHTDLWNARRETWRNLVPFGGGESMIAWAWTRYPLYSKRYSAAMADPRWSALRFVRLRTPGEVEAFLQGSGPEVRVAPRR